MCYYLNVQFQGQKVNETNRNFKKATVYINTVYITQFILPVLTLHELALCAIRCRNAVVQILRNSLLEIRNRHDDLRDMLKLYARETSYGFNYSNRTFT